MRYLKDGFTGQRMVYIPGKIKQKILSDQRINDIYISHIGYFPNAKGHYRKRSRGCSQFIFIYCKKGKGWVIIDEIKYTVTKNQIFVIPPNTPCIYGADEVDPWDNLWLHFTGNSAELFSPQVLQSISIPDGVNSRIQDRLILFEEILQNLECYFNYDNVVYANISLKYFLATIKQINNYRIHPSVEVHDVSTTAVTFMKNNINQLLKLDTIADVCHCSSSHLNKVFQNHFQCAPIDYFLQMKLQYACQYLAHSTAKIKDIALLLGYDDPYYFSRLFKKQIGKSPSGYRESEG